MISPKNSIASQNHLGLKGIFRIGGQRNFNFPLGNKEYVLVGTRFWDGKSLEVFVSEEGIHFIEIFTIISDHQFSERMRNNFLELKLSKANKNPKDDVIGLLRLPLHQFFIAFRDAAIRNRLCEGQFPVFSTDAWVSVPNTVTGEKAGEIECFLAIGTERQVENINRSRKWKVNGVNKSINFAAEDQCNNESTNAGHQNNEQLHIYKDASKEAQSESLPNASKTSDLLNMLQKSITTPTTTNLFQTVENLADRNLITETFRVYLEIKSARGLPLNTSFKVKKKFKRNPSGKGRHIRFPPEEQPTTYVTFQADDGNGDLVKSHEGMVYSTDVMEKTSNPIWGKSYSISVSLDYLTNKNKRFILKIWRKASVDLAHCRAFPCPMEDSIIGFAAIDFTAFQSNVPLISGWYNIVDFSGHINGQINVAAHPMDDLQKLVDLVQHRRENQVDFLLDSFESSLNINNISISRAIKRKFTELEEISHRLRARLLDVTGNIESDIDMAEINDEQLNEFEHDLNTIAFEDENDNISSHVNCTPTTSQSSSHSQ